MDQSLENAEILTLGAKVLGLAAGSHSKFRAEIATGDGVSLFVEAMKSYSKDVVTLSALMVGMANICYKNKDNKTAFVSHEGMDVFQPAFLLCNSMKDQSEEHSSANGTHSDSTTGAGTATGGSNTSTPEGSPRTSHSSSKSSKYTEKQLDHLASASLLLLRNVAVVTSRDKFAEPLIKSLLHFTRSYLNEKPALVSSALTCIVSLLSTSATAKARFVAKWNGISDLRHFWTLYSSHPRVMQPLTTILQLLCKINTNRVAIAQEFLPLLATQFSQTHTREPAVLLPTACVFYQLSFNSKTKKELGATPEIMKKLLVSLQVNIPSPRLHAVTAKTLIRLSSIEQCRRDIQVEGGITAILTPMNEYNGDSRVTRFLAQLINVSISGSRGTDSKDSNNHSSNSRNNSASGKKSTDSDSYSGSDEEDSDSDSDSDSSSSSSGSSRSSGSSHSSSSSGDASPKANKKKTSSTTPSASPKKSAIPILNAMDLDAAIAELEATTVLSYSNAASTAPAPPSSKSPSKKPSGVSKKSGVEDSARPGTPMEHSIDDLNALAQQLIEGENGSSSTSPRSKGSSTSSGQSSKKTGHTRTSSPHSQEEIVSKLKSDIEQLKTQLATADKEVERLTREKADLEMSSAEGARNSERLRDELSSNESTMNALRQREKDLQLQLEAVQAAETEAKNELVVLQQEIKQENATMEQQLSSLSSSLSSLQQKEERTKELESAKLALEEAKKALELSNTELAQSNANLTQTNSNLTQAKNELEKSNAELTQSKQSLETQNSLLSQQNATLSQDLDSAKLKNASIAEKAEQERKSMAEETAKLKEQLVAAAALAGAAAVTPTTTDTNNNSTKSPSSVAGNSTEDKKMYEELHNQMSALREELKAKDAHTGDLERKLQEASADHAGLLREKQKLLEEIERASADARAASAVTENTRTDRKEPSSTALDSSPQVFSPPVPSFLAPSASSLSSATGDHTDVANRPLSTPHSSGHGTDSSSAHDLLMNGSADAEKNKTSSQGDSSPLVALTQSKLTQLEEDAMMKEKGWIRLSEHESQVAKQQSEIVSLRSDLADAIEHCLHFQVLSIRLDYHSRGDEVPSIDSIRRLLTHGGDLTISSGGKIASKPNGLASSSASPPSSPIPDNHAELRPTSSKTANDKAPRKGRR